MQYAFANFTLAPPGCRRVPLSTASAGEPIRLSASSCVRLYFCAPARVGRGNRVAGMESGVLRTSAVSHQSLRFLASSSPSPFRTGINWTRSRWRRETAVGFHIRAELTLSIGTCLIPHPKKVDTGGEDAFFVSNHNGGVIAVADGVSGWAERNINPALFSKELMRHVSSLVEDEEVNCDPAILLKKAHAAMTSQGSATVIVAMLEKNGTLKIANVGDCGLLVIRRGQVMFLTAPQEHYFDCPYQISSETIGQTYQDAMVCSMNLKEGDIIIMGSDGLFDNVFNQEIVTTVSGLKDASEAAKALADLASNHSRDFYFDSPYSSEARSRGFDVPSWKKLLGQKLIGGKLDDITVVVGLVLASGNQPKAVE